MKNDTIVSVIICYDFYDNDNNIFFYSLMIENVLYSMFVYDLYSFQYSCIIYDY
jgi:hypothetical protein